jgi:hypothetical protein
MKTKLISSAILALAASFNAAAQDAAADRHDPAVICRAIVCDKSVSASEAAFERSVYVFEQRRLLNLRQEF